MNSKHRDVLRDIPLQAKLKCFYKLDKSFQKLLRPFIVRDLRRFDIVYFQSAEISEGRVLNRVLCYYEKGEFSNQYQNEFNQDINNDLMH